jgi:tRNA1(Val) A37 N6-methylase TrmN6
MTEEGAVTLDAFLGGRVALLQPRRGHRAGLDAALLAAAVPAEAAGEAVDLGCGVGTVAFAAAARAPRLTVTGVDNDAAMLALARLALARPENAAFAPRVRLIEADAALPRRAREAAGLMDGSADLVLMNPPFHKEGCSRPSPDARRRAAHVAAAGGLSAWLATAAGLLRPRGCLLLVHRADALPALLADLDGRFGALRVLPLHPRAFEPAGRVLVAAVKASRAPLALLPGLVLHEEDGRWTEPAEDCLTGQSTLPLL